MLFLYITHPVCASVFELCRNNVGLLVLVKFSSKYSQKNLIQPPCLVSLLSACSGTPVPLTWAQMVKVFSC